MTYDKIKLGYFSNERLNFTPQCPLCGSDSHDLYYWKGTTLFACPKQKDRNVTVHSPNTATVKVEFIQLYHEEYEALSEAITWSE